MISKVAAVAGVFTALGISVALGQSSTHYKTSISPSVLMDYPKPIPPGWKLTAPPVVSSNSPIIFHAVIKPNDPQSSTAPAVVINGGMGGLITEHQLRYAAIRHTGAPVEMRGGCWSACTLITGYVTKERLCFAPGAFLAFHAARNVEPPHSISHNGTWAMYATQPLDIRQWLDAHGGVNKLTIETFWFISDRELWAMGYPKCQ